MRSSVAESGVRLCATGSPARPSTYRYAPCLIILIILQSLRDLAESVAGWILELKPKSTKMAAAPNLLQGRSAVGTSRQEVISRGPLPGNSGGVREAAPKIVWLVPTLPRLPRCLGKKGGVRHSASLVSAPSAIFSIPHHRLLVILSSRIAHGRGCNLPLPGPTGSSRPTPELTRDAPVMDRLNSSHR